MPSYILHLTDLHLGKGDTRYDDDAGKTPQVSHREDVVKKLYHLLDNAPAEKGIAVIAVSGDITNRGDVSGFDEFANELLPRLQRFAPLARLCLTPGNHDVTWGIAPDHADLFTEKFQLYRDLLTKAAQSGVKLHSSLVPTGGERDIAFSDSEEPLALLDEQRLAVLCINSSIRSGELNGGLLKRPSELLNEITSLLEKLKPGLNADQKVTRSDIATRLEALTQEVRAHALLDVAHVTLPQRLKLQEQLAKAKSSIGKEWQHWTKIALLHHHVVPFKQQAIEHKSHELLVDAADVLSVLEEFDFSLVLSGHKHQSYEQSYHNFIVCGGITVGGYPVNGSPKGARMFEVTNPTSLAVATINIRDILNASEYLKKLQYRSLLFRSSAGSPPATSSQTTAVPSRPVAIVPRLKYDWFQEMRERIENHDPLDQEMLFAGPGLGRNWFAMAEAPQNGEQFQLFARCLPWLLPQLDRDLSVVDLGAGTIENIAAFVRHWRRGSSKGRLNYYPVDISYELLSRLVRGIEKADWSNCFEQLLGIHADMRQLVSCRELFAGHGQILYTFLGATLGNLERDERQLRVLSEVMRPQDRLLLQLQLSDTTGRSHETLTAAFNGSDASRRFLAGPFLACGIRFADCKIEVTTTEEPHATRYDVFCNLPQHQTLTHPSFAIPIAVRHDRFRTYVLRTYRDKELERFLLSAGLKMVAAPEPWDHGQNSRRFACILCRTI